MPDTYQKLAPLTIFYHWTVGLLMIGALSFGLYLDWLPNDAPDAARLVYIHKTVGGLILLLALARILWRYRSGLLEPIAAHRSWEVTLSRWVHIFLLAATITMPISGMMMVLGHACSACTVPVFGLFELGPLPAKIGWVSTVGGAIHHFGSKLIALVILIHVGAALKHHYWDKDATLKRMLGKTISI